MEQQVKVTVNEKPLGVPASEGATLEWLLDDLRQRGEIPADQVVVGLKVEGRQWGSEDFDLQFDAPLRGVGLVQIDTDDMLGYGRRILTDAAGMLEVICRAAGEIAQQFRADDPHEGSTNLFNLLDSLQRFLFCLAQVRNICAPDAPGPALDEATVCALDAALDQVLACQELEDWEALADCVDLNLVPALEGFQGVLVKLRDGI